MLYDGNNFYVFADLSVVLPVAYLVLVKIFSSEKNLSIPADPCLSSLTNAAALTFLDSLRTWKWNEENTRLCLQCNRGVEETVEHLVLECRKYERERESLIDVVHEQYGENMWNTRCVQGDSGMGNHVGLDEECNMTVVDEMKYHVSWCIHPPHSIVIDYDEGQGRSLSPNEEGVVVVGPINQDESLTLTCSAYGGEFQ
ncbi:hypothetical protein FHG87_003276 [Trinorchestia longiramus]|nr:hypothetical protein FHG87_003276 [Trinorchestia longiramus]